MTPSVRSARAAREMGATGAFRAIATHFVTTASRRLRPFDFSGRRLPPGRADRFQASVRNGRSWRNASVPPVAASSRTLRAFRGTALGRWCTLGQTHYPVLGDKRSPGVHDFREAPSRRTATVNADRLARTFRPHCAVLRLSRNGPRSGPHCVRLASGPYNGVIPRHAEPNARARMIRINPRSPRAAYDGPVGWQGGCSF